MHHSKAKQNSATVNILTQLDWTRRYTRPAKIQQSGRLIFFLSRHLSSFSFVAAPDIASRFAIGDNIFYISR